MKSSDHDKLLRNIFADGEMESLREASLQMGLASMRSRRRYRAATRISAALAVAVIAGSFFVRQADVSHSQLVVEKRALGAPVNENAAGSIKLISDDELLALFPKRSVALVGKSGERQQLVFLDGANE